MVTGRDTFFHRSYIFCLLMIYKFTLKHFCVGHVVFVLIIKNVIKNEKFDFAPNLCEIRKKC